MTDVVLLVLAVIFTLRGLWSGAGRPLVELLGAGIGIALAVPAHAVLTEIASPVAGLAAAVIFAGTLVIAIVVSGQLVTVVDPTFPDRIGGVVVGCATAVVVAAGLVLVAESGTPLIGGELLPADPLSAIVDGSVLLRALRDELLPALGLLRAW